MSDDVANVAMTEAGEIGRMAVAAAGNVLAGGRVAVVPSGTDLVDLERWADEPVRVRRVRKFDRMESFCRYYNENCLDRSRVFVSNHEACLNLVGVIDFSEQGAPDWEDHVLNYKARFSDQWKQWSGNDGRAFKQADFTEFLEENLADVVEPDGAALLGLIKDFRLTQKVSFGSAINLASGEVQLSYARENQQKGTTVVPVEFTLAIPVFDGAGERKVRARFFYRVGDEGKLVVSYRIHRKDAVLLAAGDELVTELENAVGVERVYRGNPG